VSAPPKVGFVSLGCPKALVDSERILTRLRAEGFLKSRDVPSDAGPPRRYFSLTPRGKVRLAEMNAYWPMLTNALEQLKSDKEKESGS